MNLKVDVSTSKSHEPNKNPETGRSENRISVLCSLHLFPLSFHLVFLICSQVPTFWLCFGVSLSLFLSFSLPFFVSVLLFHRLILFSPLSLRRWFPLLPSFFLFLYSSFCFSFSLIFLLSLSLFLLPFSFSLSLSLSLLLARALSLSFSLSHFLAHVPSLYLPLSRSPSR